MKIEKVNIDSIKVYPNNAKIHTAEQIEEIKKSIQEFGNNDPIAIDEKGFIIEGEGRYLAQKDMGVKEIEEELEEEEKIQEPSFNYKEQYGVIVICKDETEQEKVYNNLLNQGYECKVVTT